MPSEIIQVVTTTSEKRDAEALAAAILEKRLAACVQVGGPIESSYWWNARIETAREYVLTIKTHRDLYKKLAALLAELHPYDEPEILSTAVADASPSYVKWLKEQVKPGPG